MDVPRVCTAAPRSWATRYMMATIAAAAATSRMTPQYQ